MGDSLGATAYLRSDFKHFQVTEVSYEMPKLSNVEQQFWISRLSPAGYLEDKQGIVS